MIGAVVIEDMVENLIVLGGNQVEEMEQALGCEIVNARAWGLAVGDMRTAAGWTRNIDGEQVVLEEMTVERQDGYDLAVQRADAAEANASTNIDEALDMLEGQI